MNVQQYKNIILPVLTESFDAREAENLFKHALEDYFKKRYFDVKEYSLNDDEIEELNYIYEKISNHYPIQYIFNSEAETIFLFNTNNQWLSVNEILEAIANKNIISVLIEGGTDVLQQFIDSNLWNEAHIVTSDKLIDELLTVDHGQVSIKAPAINGILTNTIQLGNDTVQILKNPNALSIT